MHPHEFFKHGSLSCVLALSTELSMKYTRDIVSWYIQIWDLGKMFKLEIQTGSHRHRERKFKAMILEFNKDRQARKIL